MIQPHLWDLQNEAELKRMVDDLLKSGHHLAAYQIGSSIQCGWRHRRFPSVPDLWGMPLTGRIEALEDATGRFFIALGKGRSATFSHPSPTLSSLAQPLTPFPTQLEVHQES
jgi:hypothetical protein